MNAIERTAARPTPRALRAPLGFAQLLAGRFVRHDGLRAAAALTYTTLLSLVPLMTVMLALFSAFPIADRFSAAVQDFIFQNFVPTSGEVLKGYFQAFSDKASQLSGAGSLSLLLVALLMMNTVDRALNGIWEVERPRSLLNKFTLYWVVLTIGPLLIAVSLTATSYLISLPLVSEAMAGDAGRALWSLTPIFASTLAFTLVYVLVPQRRVGVWRALAGGLLAALLFEAAKRGFAVYITTFPTYQAIYGALATVPIFLVWVYLSWVILLLGAEFTFCLGIYRWRQAEVARQAPGLTEALVLLRTLGAAQQHGEALAPARLAAALPVCDAGALEDLLRRLRRAGLVHRTDAGHWIPARAMTRLTVYELMRLADFELPRRDGVDWPGDPQLAALYDAAEQGLRSALDAPVLATAGAPPPQAEFATQKADDAVR